MSKEFEEIVLRKLDALEEKTNSTDKLIQEKVLKRMDATDELIQEKVLKRMDATDELIQEKVLKRLDSLEEKTDETNRIVREIKQDFARFDYEINLKIDTLWDADTVNKEKHDFFEDKIVSLDAKTFNHDIRISNLEDKVLTA